MVSRGVDDINIRMPEDAHDIGNHIPTFNAYLTVIVRDFKGNVIKVHRQRSHSPTPNFMALMLPAQFYINIGGSLTLTGVGGATVSYQPGISTSSYDISYPNSATNYPTHISEIQVGSGEQSNPLSATKLAVAIASGSGTGELIYGSISIPSGVEVNGNTAYFYVAQTYTNQSGATITITEVGIVTFIEFIEPSNNSSAGGYYILTWYDVLSSAISVPNGGSVTIYYTFAVNP